MSRKALFDFARLLAPGQTFTTAQIAAGDAFADALGLPRAEDAAFDGRITERIALELLAHEAIVLEAYKDSVGVWTWGVGVTSASGHLVERYKDSPQTVQRCLEVYIWLLRERYGPAVRAAFAGHPLTEAQFGAALSFHYNTGAIGRATWVQSFKAARLDEAKAKFMEWRKPAAIIERRTKERDLFFDGKWSSDGTAIIYPVRKPSYAPNFGQGRRVMVRADLAKALAA
jgi:lysozyme